MLATAMVCSPIVDLAGRPPAIGHPSVGPFAAGSSGPGGLVIVRDVIRVIGQFRNKQTGEVGSTCRC